MVYQLKRIWERTALVALGLPLFAVAGIFGGAYLGCHHAWDLWQDAWTHAGEGLLPWK